MKHAVRRKVPVKLRVAANVVGIALCLVLIYIFLGSPVFTAQAAYRRAEKAALVGPGEILGTRIPEGQAYSHLVLARDEMGVMVYAWDRWNAGQRELVYLEKDGPLTIAAAPGRELLWTMTHAFVPVYLFDEYPGAVRAELELTISGTHEGEWGSVTYPLTALREDEGYFAFVIRTNNSKGLEGHLLVQLRNVTGNSMADTAGTEIHADVRLYDAAGEMLVSTVLELRSSAAKALQR